MSPVPWVLAVLGVAFGVTVWVGVSERRKARHREHQQFWHKVDTSVKDEQLRRVLDDPDAYFAERREHYRQGGH